MINMNESETLLGDFRVLDLTTERGFLCGKILGDFGADVIKIEPPGGEPSRYAGPFYKDIEEPEKNLHWLAYNTSKRGITLNIESKRGKEIFEQLVKTADFVIESFEPGYMDSLGLGYSALEKLNPRVIMTSITPFGQTGPSANDAASDITVWARGGFMHTVGEADPGEPCRISAPQAYLVGSLHAAWGTMIAHYYRETTGQGQYVDTSMQEAILFLPTNAYEIWDINKVNTSRAGAGWVRPRPDPPGPLAVRWNYPCKDGYVNLVFGGGSQAGLVKSMTALLKLADKESMAGHLRDYDWSKFDSSKITQEENDKMEKVLVDFFLTKTKKELYDAALEHSIVLVPLNSVKDITENKQLAARNYFVPVEHDELGETINYPGNPLKMSAAPWKIQCRAPLIGEHNAEIYCKELNISEEQLVELKAAGII